MAAALGLEEFGGLEKAGDFLGGEFFDGEEIFHEEKGVEGWRRPLSGRWSGASG
jgi:hypothetical protein